MTQDLVMTIDAGEADSVGSLSHSSRARRSPRWKLIAGGS
jgi:hypothetical protein